MAGASALCQEAILCHRWAARDFFLTFIFFTKHSPTPPTPSAWETFPRHHGTCITRVWRSISCSPTLTVESIYCHLCFQGFHKQPVQSKDRGGSRAGGIETAPLNGVGCWGEVRRLSLNRAGRQQLKSIGSIEKRKNKLWKMTAYTMKLSWVTYDMGQISRYHFFSDFQRRSNQEFGIKTWNENILTRNPPVTAKSLCQSCLLSVSVRFKIIWIGCWGVLTVCTSN